LADHIQKSLVDKQQIPDALESGQNNFQQQQKGIEHLNHSGV